jgi:hypothetical protein
VIAWIWKKGAKEFTVNVNYYDKRGYQSSIPKPVIDKLGNPDTIKFVMADKMIQLIGVQRKMVNK